MKERLASRLAFAAVGLHAVDAPPMTIKRGKQADRFSVARLKRDTRRAKFDGATLAEQFDHKPHQRKRFHPQTGENVNLYPAAASHTAHLLRQQTGQTQQ